MPHIGLELNSGELVFHRPALLGVMRKEGGGGVNRLASNMWPLLFSVLFWLLLFCFFFFFCLFLTRVQGLRGAMNLMVQCRRM